MPRGSNKLTQDVFKQKALIKQENLEILGEYVNYITKLKVRCKIDNNEFYITPSLLLNSQCSCEICRQQIMRKSHEIFVDEAKIANPMIEILSTYITHSEKVSCRCTICGYEWKTSARSILEGRQCKRCISNSLMYTDEIFNQKLHAIKPYMQLEEPYKGYRTAILCKCNNCNSVYYDMPKHLLYGKGCLKCNIGKTYGAKAQATFEQELKVVNNLVTHIGDYITSSNKTTFKCNICDHEWETTPSHLLRGQGCPKCDIAKRTKKHEVFLDEIKDIEVECLEPYNGARNKIKFRCKKDGYEWYTTPDNILRGQGCPKCNQSKGEKLIGEILNANDIKFKPQKTFPNCKDKGLLKFDFHLNDFNVAIEYHGIQHYEPFEFFKGEVGLRELQRRDKIKSDYCQANNIKLITIPYWEFSNIEKILTNELKELINNRTPHAS